jgi:hypothetical protein
VGRRDYALLLMMSLYGCGAGESIRLELGDIDWQAGTVRVVRPKTGVEILLPLLPAMARVFSDYLRHGRPRNAATRAVFVRMPPPHTALASSSAVRHILCRCAARAQVKAAFLGSHALRHAHACRQMELGARPKLIGDILGHRDRVHFGVPAWRPSVCASWPAGASMSMLTLGALGRDVEDFILFKRALGRRYEATARLLSDFRSYAERYARASSQDRVALEPLICAWLARPGTRKPTTTAQQFGVIRELCLYRRRRA